MKRPRRCCCKKMGGGVWGTSAASSCFDYFTVRLKSASPPTPHPVAPPPATAHKRRSPALALGHRGKRLRYLVDGSRKLPSRRWFESTQAEGVKG